MIFSSFFKALRQLGDPRFRRVLAIGVLLTLALLAGVYAAFLWFIQTFTPDTLDIPFVGPINGLETLLSWGSALFMAGLSVFLMVPVAAAFTGLFLEDVVAAVEDRHYPHLPAVPRLRFADSLVDAINFFGLLIFVNVLALMLYPFAGPFIPVVFWGLNGMLLGREYFTLVAMRRIGRPAAKALRKQNGWAIWAAGTLMAAPLSIPLVNIVIPVLGVATFTHIFHHLYARLDNPPPPPRA